jgi:hypothetical protein
MVKGEQEINKREVFMRISCPSDEALGEYVSGCLPAGEMPDMEKHLSGCEKCRTLVSEAGRLIRFHDTYQIRARVTVIFKKNIWLAASMIFLSLSFVFSGYFFQFLLASFLAGSKWIVDSI